jgi:hypothetical protein
MYEAQCFYHNRADEGRDIQEITVAYYVKVGRAEIPTAESQRKVRTASKAKYIDWPRNYSHIANRLASMMP